MLDELDGFPVQTGRQALSSFDIMSSPTNEDYESSVDDSEFKLAFPEGIDQWVEWHSTDCFDMPWEYLRDFFASHGYELYVCPPRSRHSRDLCVPEAAGPMPITNFGTIGSFVYVPEYRATEIGIWAARSREGRHVLVNATHTRAEVERKSCDSETDSKDELKIMDYLSQVEMEEDAAIPLTSIDRIRYGDWLFVIYPRWQSVFITTPAFDELFPFPDPLDFLRFCKEVCKGFAFLHRHRIAHLNIRPENIMMNILSGAFLVYDWFQGSRFLHNLPVKFGIQDFGFARHFAEDTAGPCTVDPCIHRQGDVPPETRRRDPKPFDPFAADVHQLGSLFVTFFTTRVKEIPEVGSIFEHMTKIEPKERISMCEAAALFEDIIQKRVCRQPNSGINYHVEHVGVVMRPEEEDMDGYEDFSDASLSESEGED
ncbi:hypothetical protein K474DRAFT_1709967 [Panus rudis PR-1116 ss-1]|nr:hypothetical protein K474DRAFT_1709967 [Panus rudis PR-1116 ss-1]